VLFLDIRQPQIDNKRIMINQPPCFITNKIAYEQNLLRRALCCIHLTLNTHAQTTVTITASADNTIYQDNTSNSNGAGQNLFAGNTGPTSGNSPRRALLKFDLSTIPAGSSVTAAALLLFANKTVAGNETIPQFIRY
jgi:hypothetical protein